MYLYDCTDVFISRRDVLGVERIGMVPVIISTGDMRKGAMDRNGRYIRDFPVSVEGRVGPVANGIKSPCPKSIEGGGLPFLQPVGAVFPF